MAAEFLPSEVSYKELKANIKTRRALNNTVNRLIRATKPDALTFVRQDDGSLVTKFERREFNILKSVRERKKSMAAKREGVLKPEQGRIGSIRQAELSRDGRKASGLSGKSLKRFIETQFKAINESSEEKARRYFSNYVKALRSVFGGFAEYDEGIELIVEAIQDIGRSDFYSLKKAVDGSPNIEFIYEPLARTAKLARLVEYWQGLGGFAGGNDA